MWIIHLLLHLTLRPKRLKRGMLQIGLCEAYPLVTSQRNLQFCLLLISSIWTLSCQCGRDNDRSPNPTLVRLGLAVICRAKTPNLSVAGEKLSRKISFDFPQFLSEHFCPLFFVTDVVCCKCLPCCSNDSDRLNDVITSIREKPTQLVQMDEFLNALLESRYARIIDWIFPVACLAGIRRDDRWCRSLGASLQFYLQMSFKTCLTISLAQIMFRLTSFRISNLTLGSLESEALNQNRALLNASEITILFSGFQLWLGGTK